MRLPLPWLPASQARSNSIASFIQSAARSRSACSYHVRRWIVSVRTPLPRIGS
jgi:hypothetical protein